MDSRDWLTLKTIEEEHSLTRAAEKLFISQPSLTYRLQKMEKELDIVILNRSSEGVTFTYEGEHLLEYAKEMLRSLSQLRLDFIKMKEPITGELSLWSCTVYSKYKLAQLIKAFSDYYPEIKINLKTGSSTHLDTKKPFQHDLYIFRGETEWKGKKQIILKEPYGIVSASPFKLEMLEETPLIQYDYPSKKGGDPILSHWLSERPHPIVFKKVITVNSIEAAIELTSQGIGWCMVPHIHVERKSNLHFYPLKTLENFPVNLMTILLAPPSALEKAPVKAFWDFAMYYSNRF